MTNEVFIEEPTKRKVSIFLINAFLIFGLLFIPSDSELLPQMPSWYNQLDLILTVILGVPLLWQLRSLFIKTGLKLTTEGIEINTNPYRVQRFHWSEIANIRFMKISFLKYMLIYISDPHSYYKKQNIFRRLWMKSDIKRFGTPIKIPIHNINRTPQEIALMISEYTKGLRA